LVTFHAAESHFRVGECCCVEIFFFACLEQRVDRSSEKNALLCVFGCIISPPARFLAHSSQSGRMIPHHCKVRHGDAFEDALRVVQLLTHHLASAGIVARLCKKREGNQSDNPQNRGEKRSLNVHSSSECG